MIIDEEDFRAAVKAAAERYHPMAGDTYPTDAFVQDVVTYAHEYAPVHVQEQHRVARESGAARCDGPCCGRG